MSQIVKEARAIAKSRGGDADRILTRYDHERGGRVMEVVLFFPGMSGYDKPGDYAALDQREGR